ncbi:MAG: KamA family radical SAM protein [Actinobacteria bacterium]|nr:KamA family radical SAM protein [Actinomycetota bacterium]
MTKVMTKVRYLTRLDQIPHLTAAEKAELQPVVAHYAFRVNSYYSGLIDWSDREDPIRRLVIPDVAELDPWGRLDPSDERAYAKVPGLEHKYEFTALLLVNDICGSFCRFCFRKRLFMNENVEVVRDVAPGLAYIREHPQINNVLLTGGDPLLLSTKRIRHILSELRRIDHVHIVRIGSKMPAFNPFRILNDPELVRTLGEFSRDDKRIYLMVHYNHPRELTTEAVAALDQLQRAGVVICNQTPLLRGINDDPAVLGELFNTLSYVGAPPYYVFIGRPTRGNRHFAVPVEEAFAIFEQARMRCSGLAKRARLVMSHSTGKIEIVGLTDTQIYFRYHRAADPQEKARFMVCERNPEAHWFDDYVQITKDHSVENPFRIHGPRQAQGNPASDSV